MNSTLLLTRSEIASLIDHDALLSKLRRAFVDYSTSRTVHAQRFPISLPKPSPEGAGIMLLAPGLAGDIPAYSVKVHAKFPQNQPAIQGVIVLHDISTGYPLAILESTLITAIRTGLAGAIGADVLAKTGPVDIAIVGAGTQGAFQLEYLKLVRKIGRVVVFDNAPGKSERFAAEQSKRHNLPVSAIESLQNAVASADIIVTATWAQSPFLFPGMVKKGAHITTLGPDQPGKCEVDAELMRASVVVCDDKDLAVEMGAVGGAGLGAEAVHAELGEVLAGQKSGRVTTSEITVFASVGLAFQDLVAAWDVYRRAIEEKRGSFIQLLD